MKASDLDQRVVISQRVAGVDAFGQASEVWQVFANPWANVRRVKAADFTSADAPQASGTISIALRKIDGLTSSMRIEWDSRSWDLVGEPIPLDRSFVRIEATTGVRDAA
jgi:SPP1 family predicted phage head-tail adaptor